MGSRAQHGRGRRRLQREEDNWAVRPCVDHEMASAVGRISGSAGPRRLLHERQTGSTASGWL